MTGNLFILTASILGLLVVAMTPYSLIVALMYPGTWLLAWFGWMAAAEIWGEITTRGDAA